MEEGQTALRELPKPLPASFLPSIHYASLHVRVVKDTDMPSVIYKCVYPLSFILSIQISTSKILNSILKKNCDGKTIFFYKSIIY